MLLEGIEGNCLALRVFQGRGEQLEQSWEVLLELQTEKLKSVLKCTHDSSLSAACVCRELTSSAAVFMMELRRSNPTCRIGR